MSNDLHDLVASSVPLRNSTEVPFAIKCLEMLDLKGDVTFSLPASVLEDTCTVEVISGIVTGEHCRVVYETGDFQFVLSTKIVTCINSRNIYVLDQVIGVSKGSSLVVEPTSYGPIFVSCGDKIPVGTVAEPVMIALPAASPPDTCNTVCAPYGQEVPEVCHPSPEIDSI